jgi:predicted transcriptional regulator
MDQRIYPDDIQEFIERCESLGVNQAEIARRAKLSTAAVSYIFTGERSFSEPARSKMWTALFDVMGEKSDQAIKFARAEKLGAQLAGRLGDGIQKPWYEYPGAFAVNRRLAKIRQGELAERVGVSQALVSLHENGLQSWDTDTGKKILKAYYDLVTERSKKNAEEYLKSDEFAKEHAANIKIYGPNYALNPFYSVNEVLGQNPQNPITQKKRKREALRAENELLRWTNEQLYRKIEIYEKGDWKGMREEATKVFDQLKQLQAENEKLRQENEGAWARLAEIEAKFVSKEEYYGMLNELAQVEVDGAINHEKAEALREKIREAKRGLESTGEADEK